MPSCSLKCFGTGDGWPCADRFHSSYLYRLGDAVVLVDCGEPISRNYKASGLPYDLIDAIVLTHLHFDHVGGLCMLLQGFWLEKRRKPLVIHCPSEGMAPLRQLLDAGCLFPELIGFPLQFQPLQDRRPILVKGLTLLPLANTHLHGFRRVYGERHPQGYEAYSLLFETEGHRVAHTSDIGSVSDVAGLCAEPLELLVCELSHISLEELCLFLRERPIERLLFTHLSRPYWDHFDRTRARAAALLPGRLFDFARDGQELSW